MKINFLILHFRFSRSAKAIKVFMSYDFKDVRDGKRLA